MKTRLVATTAVLVMVCFGAAGCGDDDGGGGESGGGAQQQVADQTIEMLEEMGAEVDAACVEEVTASLSDSDAQAILESYDTDEDPDVSEAGMAAADELVNCVELEASE